MGKLAVLSCLRLSFMTFFSEAWQSNFHASQIRFFLLRRAKGEAFLIQIRIQPSKKEIRGNELISSFLYFFTCDGRTPFWNRKGSISSFWNLECREEKSPLNQDNWTKPLFLTLKNLSVYQYPAAAGPTKKFFPCFFPHVDLFLFPRRSTSGTSWCYY